MPDDRKTTQFCQRAEALTQGMFVLALSILKNQQDAEDAVQNTLLLAYQHLDELRFLEKFKPWLFRILTRECYRLAEERRRELSLELPDLASPPPDTDTRVTLWDAVQALPPDYRAPVVLFYYQDMNLSDIAKALDISVDAAKKRLSRGREQLRGVLSKEDFT